MTTNNSVEEIAKSINEKRAQIKKMSRTALVKTSMGVEKVSEEWTDVPSTNVRQRLCSIDYECSEVTCCNMVFEHGGKIQPHTTDKLKTIFCAEGVYYDPVNNTTLFPGEKQLVQPGQLHAGESDNCLLFVTYKPAFSYIEEEA